MVFYLVFSYLYFELSLCLKWSVTNMIVNPCLKNLHFTITSATVVKWCHMGPLPSDHGKKIKFKYNFQIDGL